ncbi:MAG: hypothetical protein RMJ19_11250 [Gemmatales bacterium]|nr:hypothetical protein [Gemmatales bacterium]MCS7161037.1 hypothetical protein [Gemmatales bacterium]MDW8176240.1 hypothetical protein [Gemmatales bacterium]MDW8222118.1 hypothetical protein [Gemmatales bacterium]
MMTILPGQTARLPCIVESGEYERELAGQIHLFFDDLALRELIVYVCGEVKGQPKQPESKDR